jgi:hypothetical protein
MSVRGGPKTFVVACVALLLAVGLVACGGSDGSDSTSTTAASQSRANAPSGDTTQGGDEGKSGSGSQEKSGSDSSSTPDASDFVPKQHSDSGGGSEQFKVKGGDNSVQEFGEEADASELDAAAAALHNFLDARAEGNWAAACNYMSKGIIESFEKLASQAKEVEDTSCGALLEKLTNPAAKSEMKAEAEKADVRSLRMEGEQAFLVYTGTKGAVLAIPMANEDGEWKVASLAGTPLN